MSTCAAVIVFCSFAFGTNRSSKKLLANPLFEAGLGGSGIPKGWSIYSGEGKGQRLSLVTGGGTAMLTEAQEAVTGRRAPGDEAQAAPVYSKLKKLYLTTLLVKNGKPNAKIIAPASGVYNKQAKAIAQTIEYITKVELPIVSDEAPQAAVPIKSNLIALGNRSTNKTIEELYNRYFTLLDLRYPDSGGYVVRTLHNPFGNGHNVVFIGGSDLAGLMAATDQFIKRLNEADSTGGHGELSIGWIADIKLSRAFQASTNMKSIPLWSASEGYRNSGFFGWNILSKRAALYYMTGDPFHAKEFMRLAFPDKRAVEDIRDVDMGKVDVTDPLTGLDHYRSDRMILYWDLIEESPVFTDKERLQVTNAFARQLNYRKKERIYKSSVPALSVGTRHDQWGAISVYTLCRYFSRDYPDPVWKDGLKLAQWEFASLHEYAWVHGENDNLFWYNTSMEPLTNYLLLSGDREPLRNGVFKKLMTAQEILIPGITSHKHIRYGALNWFNKVAYLTQDGRWLFYRDQTNVLDEEEPFRLGQSFWPDESLQRKPPTDLVGKWMVSFMPAARWRTLRNGLPLKETFTFASFRSQPDASGDYVLLDGDNGDGRNPYHSFALVELRIEGYTVLTGHENQLISKVDGMVEPVVAKFAALKDYGVVGNTAFSVAEVPNAAYCNWRRMLIQRVGHYALVVDVLKSCMSNQNIEIWTNWKTRKPNWAPESNRLHLRAPKFDGSSEVFGISPSDLVQTKVDGMVSAMRRIVTTRERKNIVSFSLIARSKNVGPACIRRSDNSAALQLPASNRADVFEAGVALAGQYKKMRAEVAILTGSHLFGVQMTQGGLDDSMLVSNKPVDTEWDFKAGTLHVEATSTTRLSLALLSSAQVHVDDKSTHVEKIDDGLKTFILPAGRHVLEGARLSPDVLRRVQIGLTTLNEEAKTMRATEVAGHKSQPIPDVPTLQNGFSAEVGGKIQDVEIIETEKESFIAAAVGKTIYVLNSDGDIVQKMKADDDIRVIHWWQESALLLSGSIDEKVIAFDFNPKEKGESGGHRRWIFVSEMAPWLYTHQASHWWKEAGPRFAGIHGLTSGSFLERDGTQAIVGSASTVEILNESGELLERKEQVWGNIVHSIIIPGPDGSRNLLSLRHPSLTNRVNILNNRTLKTGVFGFFDVPAGYTQIRSWDGARYHLFHEDLDGDGKKEVIGEISGQWNRVGVWDESGIAKHNAPFGPGLGDSRSLRGIEVLDLEADGKVEILVATDMGLVIVLDAHLLKKWSTMLSSPPTILKAIVPTESRRPWIVMGSQNGTLVVLDSKGSIIRQGIIEGRPNHITMMKKDGKRYALLTTTGGAIASFKVGD
jgi:hypothetical protein